MTRQSSDIKKELKKTTLPSCKLFLIIHVTLAPGELSCTQSEQTQILENFFSVINNNNNHLSRHLEVLLCIYTERTTFFYTTRNTYIKKLKIQLR